MALILEEKPGVSITTELYAPDIRIRGNPEDKAAGSILLELHKLEYHGEAFIRMDPLGTVGESVGEFAQREFQVNGKTITGLDVVAIVEAYTAMIYQERFAPAPQPPAPLEDEVE